MWWLKRVNLGRLGLDQARRALVHEFWHALPTTPTRSDLAGGALRIAGFWVQRRGPGRTVWIPLHRQPGLLFAPYLPAGGMASLMESNYLGYSAAQRQDIEAAQRFLGLFGGLAGRRELSRLYLESRPADLAPFVQAHHAELFGGFLVASR